MKPSSLQVVILILLLSPALIGAVVALLFPLIVAMADLLEQLTDFEFGSGSGYISPLAIALLLSALIAAIVLVAWIFWPKRRDEP